MPCQNSFSIQPAPPQSSHGRKRVLSGFRAKGLGGSLISAILVIPCPWILTTPWLPHHAIQRPMLAPPAVVIAEHGVDGIGAGVASILGIGWEFPCHVTP